MPSYRKLIAIKKPSHWEGFSKLAQNINYLMPQVYRLLIPLELVQEIILE